MSDIPHLPTPEEAFDHGFQSAIIIALEIANSFGCVEFMNKLVQRVDQDSDKAGLPRLSIPLHINLNNMVSPLKEKLDERSL